MRPAALTLWLLIIVYFLVGCAHFSYENEDLVICLKKESYIKEFCWNGVCEKLDACGRVIYTYEK